MYELDDEPTEDIPVFIGELHDGQIHHPCFGQYHAPRWSDCLDYDRMIEEVPGD